MRYSGLRAVQGPVLTRVHKLLLRWVDDYLFITTEEQKANQFLRVMNAGQLYDFVISMYFLMTFLGHPEYGCLISHEKTLTNFYSEIHSPKVLSQTAGNASSLRCSTSY